MVSIVHIVRIVAGMVWGLHPATGHTTIPDNLSHADKLEVGRKKVLGHLNVAMITVSDSSPT